MKRCFLSPKTLHPCYIQLGRLGDIMIMLPAMKHIFDMTGVKPVMMVCSEFVGMLEGCSYVIPWPMAGFSWYGDVKLAKDIADHWYDTVVVPKWWDCPGLQPPPPKAGEAVVILNHQGRRMVVAAPEWDSYQYSQWKAAGFTKQEMLDLPLVFDRRNEAREAILAVNHLPKGKPAVLYNFGGLSNPMPYEPEVLRELQSLRDRVHLVNLRNIQADRIQDLLGLYDRALCLITGDTATLHLAAASKVPMIALVANGGAGSIPKGNTVLKLRYGEVSAKVSLIKATVQKLLK